MFQTLDVTFEWLLYIFNPKSDIMAIKVYRFQVKNALSGFYVYKEMMRKRVKLEMKWKLILTKISYLKKLIRTCCAFKIQSCKQYTKGNISSCLLFPFSLRVENYTERSSPSSTDHLQFLLMGPKSQCCLHFLAKECYQYNK